MRVTRAAAAPEPGPPRVTMRVGSPSGDQRSSLGFVLQPIEPALGPVDAERSGRSRCPARPGSPTARRARRWRSAAGSARCRRACGPATKVVRSAQQFVDLEPGHIVGEVEGMGADVAERSRRRRRAPGRRATRPACCRWSRSGRSASPADIRPGRGGSRQARPPRPFRAHAADQRIAGVVVGQREDAPRRPRPRLQRLGLGERSRQRLVADDVDARLEKGVGRPERARGWA